MNRLSQGRPGLNNQQGFASLVVGLVLIVVLGLLTVSFALLTRHEQQQALSKQLASEAYYAAETGINDVVKEISSKNITTATTGVDLKQCIDTSLLTYSTTVNSSAGISYSCVIVDLSSPTLEYKNLGKDASQSVVTDTAVPLKDLSIHWESADGNTSPVPGQPGSFLPTASWGNHPAVIQFSVTPLGGGYTRANLIADTFNIFLYPATSNSTSTVTFSGSASQQGYIASGGCAAASGCNATIQQIIPTGPYLIHFLNYYDTSNVRISGTDINGDPAVFTGGQATIDVTGKARNVLKRLQVRVPLNSQASGPNYAIEAKTICKRIATQPRTTPATTVFIDQTGAQAAAKSACDLEF